MKAFYISTILESFQLTFGGLDKIAVNSVYCKLQLKNLHRGWKSKTLEAARFERPGAFIRDVIDKTHKSGGIPSFPSRIGLISSFLFKMPTFMTSYLLI